ncbi:MAG TPA: 3-hydroxyacyl-CoA dehydrogenase NAD-binding domain-containing protein [Gemmatimonadales bacterium]
MSAFTVERDGDVAVVVFDLPGEAVNKFSRAVKDEFRATMDALRSDPSAKGVVIISGKPENFIAGADIEEFVAAKSEDEFRTLSREGQKFLDELAAFPKTVVVAINGACMGGGLEISLACHYRIATSHPKTVLALPETQLGIIPGAGGCNRLPRLVGLRAALDMILSARNIRPDKALKMGLVDEVVHPAILRDVAIRAARAGRVPARLGRPAGLASWFLDGTGPGRAIVLRQARATTLKKSGGHYPALPAAIGVVEYSLARGLELGLVREADVFAGTAMTTVSRRLVEIFFATTALKKDPGVEPPAPAPKPVERLGILGAGFMGAGIAVTAADQAGVSVRMKDADLPRVAKGLKSVAGIIGESVKRRRFHRRDAIRKLALVSGGTDFAGFRRADLVIEAVFEDLEVKRAVLREIESVSPSTIFASNTSTIPIARIAEASKHPETVIGMHFFSPVHRMPLLEVIAAEKTSKDTVVTAVAFGRKMGKTVIVVRDRPGFFINRILSPYMNEAGHLLKEGARIEAIDAAMTAWGFPVGPVTLMDEVGLDVAVKAAGVMHDALGERLAPAISIDALVKSGRMGRKNGKGFFQYQGGKKGAPDEAVYGVLGITAQAAPPAEYDMVARLTLAMLNEAVRALDEGVIRQPRDGDIGAIYGFGYPPFRGGPFRTLDAMGAASAVSTLERLAAKHGPRFTPASMLADLAKRGGRFYPER